jgi:amino acid adenylation domain-containing protein/natural product biosynthesis luciferase-like monooxygenase protein
MAQDERIAVIGMAFRFAGGDSPEAYWRTVRAGTSHVRRFTPAERAGQDWDPGFVAAGAVLPDVEGFDAGFFGMSGPETEATDPQQRMFLECAYHALEDGGYPATDPDTTVGVYGSSGFLDQWAASTRSPVDDETDLIATRTADRLGLTGPASSARSGLRAVQLACQGLREGDADLALVGAAAVRLPHLADYHRVCGSIVSPTGECRAFDADADGCVGGSAVVAVLLKPFERAVADGDTVHAVIEGIGVSTGGGAPSATAQREAVLRALADSGSTARDIGYLETQGDGTVEGDRIEVQELTSAFRRHTEEAGFCGLGAAKPAIGHTDVCAGLAGLIKAILVLRHGEIPPLPGFRRPHPLLPLDDSPFFLPTRPQAWPRGERLRRAAVHAVDGDGTTVHVILAEPPQPEPPQPEPPQPTHPVPGFLLLSGRDPAALRESAAAYLDLLRASPDIDRVGLVTTTTLGRRHLGHRLVLAGDTVPALERQLAGYLAEGTDQVGVVPVDGVLAPGFLFSGHGSRLAGSARPLYHRFAAVRAALDEAEDIFRAEHPDSLLDLLLGTEAVATARIAHPALFALQAALLRLWQDAGVVPGLVGGHSGGEYAALYAAGALPFGAGVRLAALHGKLHADSTAPTSLSLPVLPELAEAVAAAGVGATTVSFASGIDGVVRTAGWTPGAGYFTDQARRPVRAMLAAFAGHGPCAVELGPADLLARLARAVRPAPTVLPTLCLADGAATFWTAAAELHRQGHVVRWDRLLDGTGGRRIPLPGYRFRHQTYPVAARSGPPAPSDEKSEGTAMVDPAQSEPVRGADPALADADDRRREHVADLVRRYTAKTRTSRELARRFEPVLAVSVIDPLRYPITGREGTGSRLTDVDGNRYLDFVMGDGALLFGHQPEFVAEPVRRLLSRGVQLSIGHQETGEVAELLSALTGLDRVAFAGSVSEAASAARGLARVATGRHRIVSFTDVPRGPAGSDAVADQLVLEYGSEESLRVIEERAGSVAAVVVEPMSCGHPRPADFLVSLRELTRRHGIVLIFDESVTGFRLHVRGAQGYFDVPADLATYGNALGGGFPIAAIAGRTDLMADRPGGGISPHPAAMVAAKAVLAHLREQGPGLQDGLNARTDALARRLDRFFADEEFPLGLRHFGSMFSFDQHSDLDLLSPHLVLKGVLAAARRTFFLSTAHTDADLDFLHEAITGSLHELRDAGYLRPPDRLTSIPRARVAAGSAPAPAPRAARQLDIGLCFSGDYLEHSAAQPGALMDLVLEAAEYADTQGFSSLWLPDRHVDSGGGLFPRPAVLAAALAVRTRRIRINAGSVLHRHDPARLVEEWSMADNLSHGRVGFGWNSGDVVVSAGHGCGEELMYEWAEEVRECWREGVVPRLAEDGTPETVPLVPRPIQAEAPMFSAVAGCPEAYEQAAERGFDVVTTLLTQSVGRLAENIARYRKVRADHGLDPDGGRVVVLVHTYLSDDRDRARAEAREPLLRRLRSSAALFGEVATSLGARTDLDAAHSDDREYVFGWAYDRYCDERALIGSPDSCASLVEAIRAAGADEIAAMIDFGVSGEEVRAELHLLDQVRHGIRDAAGTGETDLAWWRAYLGAEPPVLQVPTDRPRDRRATAAHASVAATIAAGPTARLHTWSGENRVTLLAAMATAWQAVLRRFSGQDEFLLGITSGARSPVPLRCAVNDAQSLGDAARLLHKDLLAVSEHGEPAWEVSRPLVPVSIDFEGDRPADTAPRELGLLVTGDDDRLGLRVRYDTALFDEGTARRYLDHLVLVLETMGTGDVALAGDLPMLSDVARAELRKLGEGDPLSEVVPLPGAARPPAGAEIAVVAGPVRWSRDRLRATADALAGRLAAEGVGRGDLVALGLPRTPAYLAALLAVTDRGAAYLPLDLGQPSSRLTAILTDAQPAVLVCLDPGGPLTSVVPGTPCIVVRDLIGADLPAVAGDAVPDRRVAEPDDLLSVVYTSGSTGGPKGVEITYGNLATLLAGYQQRYPVTAADRLAWFSSPGFDSAQAEIWPALTHGAQLHIVPDDLRLDPAGLARWLVAHRITQLIVPTPIGEQLLAREWPAETVLRRVFTGGEQLNRRPAPGLPFDFINVYGPTETTVFISTGTVEPEGTEAPPLGRPMPGALLEIRDEAGWLLPPGAPGELHVAGPLVARGYRSAPVPTAERFRTGSDGLRRYATGDLARWRADGQLQFLGRADDQVQIRGVRVEPAEVTHALLALDDIRDALVLGSTDPGTGTSVLTAHVCPREPLADQAAAVRSWRSRLAELVPRAMVPERWEVSDRLPTTLSGKRDRAGLRVGSPPAAPAPPVAEPDVRESVRAAWRQVLDTEDIPADASFFDLGGHSLAVMRLLDLMEADMGVRVSIAEFFADPTVDGILAAAAAEPLAPRR